jgi:hypothetical protein
VGFVVDEVALGQVFSEYFSFSWQFSLLQMLHLSSPLLLPPPPVHTFQLLVVFFNFGFCPFFLPPFPFSLQLLF